MLMFSKHSNKFLDLFWNRLKYIFIFITKDFIFHMKNIKLCMDCKKVIMYCTTMYICIRWNFRNNISYLLRKKRIKLNHIL